MNELLRRHRIALFVALTIAMAAAATSAFAHVPALESSRKHGETVPMGGPDVSRATYGYLSPSEEHDDYEFSVSKPVDSVVGIIVPAYREHADFRPTLVVKPEGESPIAVEDPQKAPRVSEWEPFSLTTFWWGGEREIHFEAGKRYALRVEPGPGEQSGRYVIVFGGPERFEPSDIAATFRELPRIWFGAYGGAPFHINALALLPIWILLLLVSAVAFGVVWLVRRRRSRLEE